jgi:hypothetical protein
MPIYAAPNYVKVKESVIIYSTQPAKNITS